MDALASIMPAEQFYPAALVWIACGLASVLIVDWARTEPVLSVGRRDSLNDGLVGNVIGGAAAGAMIAYAIANALQ